MWNRVLKANKTIEQTRDILKYEDLSAFVDEKKVTYENLDNLNQIELFALLDKHPVPVSRLALLGAASLLYFAGVTYLAVRKGPAYMLKSTEGKSKTLGTMIMTGTKITSQIFLGYVLLMTPLVYFTDIMNVMEKSSRIRTRLGNSIVINDDDIQEYLLLSTMKYFGLSDPLLQQTKRELQDRKLKMQLEHASLDAVVRKLEAAGHVKVKSSKLKDYDKDL